MHGKYKLILFTLLCIITRVGYSQPWYFNEIFNPNKTWASGLSIVGIEEGYFGCSISSDSITGYYNTCTFLINPKGELVSWKNFGLSGFNFFPGYYGSLIKATDNCFALFGSTRNLSSGLSNGLFYKFNMLGDTLFTKSFFSETYNMLVGRACASTINGGYSLLGEVSVGANYSDLILIKTDDEANEIWRSQQGTAIDDLGVSVIQTSDSGFALGAWAYTPGQVESGDPLVIKTDSLGNFEWTLNFGGPYKDDKAMVFNTSDSSIMVLTAYADSMWTPEHAYTRINLVKIDLEGNVIWNRKYGASKPVNYISNLIQIPNGDYVLCGYSMLDAYLPAAGWIMEINSDGDSLWYRDYFYYPEDPSYGFNYLHDISLTSDNGFVATGQAYTLTPPNNVQKMWVLKVDSVGCEIANCWVGVGEEDKTVGRYDDKKGGLEVWPNPAREQIHIRFYMDDGRFYNGLGLEIYDIFGRPAQTTVFQPAGGEGVTWTVDISALLPGIYFVRLRDLQTALANAKFVVMR